MSNQTTRSTLLRLHDKDVGRTAIIRSLANSGKGLFQVATLDTGTAVAIDDTLNLGGVSYVFKSIIARASSAAVNGTINSTTTGTTLTFATAPVTNVIVGEVLRCQNEYLIVTKVESTTVCLVERGAFGSTAATQTATPVIRGGIGGDVAFVAADRVTTVMGGKYVIPTANTYTNTSIRPLITKAINYWESKIGSGLTAIDSGGTGIVHFVRPYSAGDKVNTGALGTATDGAVTLFTTDVDARLNRDDVIKCESEYLKVVSNDSINGKTYTVTRSFNAAAGGAAHAAQIVYRVQQPNSFSRTSGSALMDTEWSGGVDDLAVTKAEYVHSWVSGTSFTLWLPPLAKAAEARLYDASASGAVLFTGAAAPSCVLSLTNRKLVVTEGSTPFATSDIIVVTVWF